MGDTEDAGGHAARVDGPAAGPDPAAQRRAFLLGALVLLAVATLFRTAVTGVGWFHADDFAGIARSQDPFLDAVTYGEGGHVAWVQNAWNWWFAQQFAYRWPVYVASTMLGFVVMSLLLLVLLRRLWGERPAVLGLWSVWLFASLVTASTTWHSQSLLFFFLVAPSLVTAWALDRGLTGSPWWLAAAGLAFGGALLCSERAAGLVPVLAVLLVLARGAGGTPRVRRVVTALGLVAVIAAGFLAVYLSRGVLDVDRGAVSVADRLTWWREGAAAVVTGLVGGPWTMDSTPVIAAGAPTVVQVVLSLALLVAVAALCGLRAGWRATLAWIVLAAYAVVSVLLVTSARASVLGISSLRDVRYYSDLQVVLVLTVGIGLLGPALGRWWPYARGALVAARSTVVVLTVALAALTVATSVQIAAHWSDNPARGYFANTLADLSTAPGLAMVDSQLPPDVITPLLTTDTLAARVLVGFPGAPVFGVGAPVLGILGTDGHVHPARVEGGTASVEVQGSACPYPVPATGATIPLQTTLFDWNWLVQLDYHAARPGQAAVQVGDGTIEGVPVERGEGTVFVMATGGGQTVEVTPQTPGLQLCVSRVLVGNPAPDPDRRVGGAG